jgi:hypothetical protein
MRILCSALLAGAAAAAMLALPAQAQNSQVHTLLVQLPSGQIERVEYTGDVAPRVQLAPTLPAAMLPGFDWQPFADLQRISAMMDAEADAMLQQSAAPSLAAESLPGTQQAAFVASFSSNGACTRSMQITDPADGARPQIVSHSSGNCGASAPGSASAQVNAPAAAPAPRFIEAKAGPVGAPLEQVAWRNR